MEQQFLRDAGGKKLGSCVVGTVPHHFSALPGRQLFSADINFPTALLLQPRQNHGKGSFSRAVSASQGGDLPGGQRKIQIFKNKGIAQGIERGIAQGMEKGIERGTNRERLQNIRSLMETTGWPAEQVMTAMKIPAADQPKYLKLLSLPQ